MTVHQVILEQLALKDNEEKLVLQVPLDHLAQLDLLDQEGMMVSLVLKAKGVKVDPRVRLDRLEGQVLREQRERLVNLDPAAQVGQLGQLDLLDRKEKVVQLVNQGPVDKVDNQV